MAMATANWEKKSNKSTSGEWRTAALIPINTSTAASSTAVKKAANSQMLPTIA